MTTKKKQIVIDQKIINAFRKGELWAFELIYQEISLFIYNVVFKMIRSKEETEDLTHDIFIKLYNNSVKFNSSVKLTTWAYRIAVNHTLNHIKRKKTLGSKLADLLFHNNTVVDDHKKIEYEDTKKMVHDILSHIKPEFRICLILREFEGQSYHDIADILKISLGTVKSRISRAKSEFLQLYNQLVGGQNYVKTY